MAPEPHSGADTEPGPGEPTEPLARPWRRDQRFLVALAVGLFALQAPLYHAFLGTGFDEGYYLYSSWLVCSAGIAPYRDMNYQYGPLLPYVYGVPQSVFGAGFGVGRGVALFFTALALLLAYRAAAAFAGRTAGACALLLLVADPNLLQPLSAALPYAPCSACLLAGALLLGEGWTSRVRVAAGLACFVLAALLRQNLAPYVLVAAAVVSGKDLVRWCFCAAVGLGVAAVGALPAIVSGGTAFFEQTLAPMLGAPFERPYELGPDWSVKAWLGCLWTLAGAHPLLWPLLLAGLIGLFGRGFQAPGNGGAPRRPTSRLGGLLAALVGAGALVHHAYRPTSRTFPDYASYYLPLAVPLAAAPLAARWDRAAEAWQARPALVVALLLCFPAAGVPNLGHPLSGACDRAALAAAGGDVAAAVRTDERMFSFCYPSLFAESGRLLLPELTRNFYFFSPSGRTDVVRRYHGTNPEIVLELLATSADVALLDARAWGVFAAHGDLADRVREALAARFERAATIRGTPQGDLEVYRRVR
ncbi:MAG: hypothetical protein HYZ53_00430 [Planctomycetes bacterium]|nr:hypothetical protein [Planctomycetota bacterium]